MSYLTKHTITWKNESWAPARKRRRSLDEALSDEVGHYIASHPDMMWVFESTGEYRAPVAWKTCEADMRAISVAFPGVLFHLIGEGEDLGDIWDMFAKDGKVQRHKAVICRDDKPRDGEWK